MADWLSYRLAATLTATTPPLNPKSFNSNGRLSDYQAPDSAPPRRGIVASDERELFVVIHFAAVLFFYPSGFKDAEHIDDSVTGCNKMRLDCRDNF